MNKKSPFRIPMNPQALFSLRRPAGIILAAVIFFLCLGCASVLLGYFPWQMEHYPPDPSWRMVVLAKISGAAIPLLLLVQFCIISRNTLLTRIFSQHGLMRAHRVMALIILAAAGMHFLLMERSGHLSLTSLDAGTLPRLLGITAFILLFCGTGTAFFRQKISLPYHLWFIFHGPVMGSVALLIYIHIFTVGYGFMEGPARWFIMTIMGAHLILIFWLKAVRPRIIAGKAWTVVSTLHPTPDIVEVHLSRTTSAPFFHLPGQYAFLRFLSMNIPAEEHPFTIACAPSHNNTLRFFIKKCGDYTATLDALIPGTQTLLDGPFGIFSPAFHTPPDHPQPSLVMIAGGIGITPFLAMIQEASVHTHPPSILLIWSVRTARDLFLEKEFTDLQKKMPGLQLHFFVTRDTSGPGYGCRLTPLRLEKILAKWHAATVFICGPPAMTSSLSTSLKKLGFSRHDLITERFIL